MSIGGLLFLLAVFAAFAVLAFVKMQALGYNALGSAAVGVGIGLVWCATMLARARR